MKKQARLDLFGYSTMSESRVLELFGHPTQASEGVAWQNIVERQWCPFTNTKCFKVRKSQPEISIGTCTVRHGSKQEKDVIICPNRLLERKQVFTDSLHLLTLHEPGNELHVVSEVSIPGGSVDYFLVSAKEGKVKDFVAIEFQTLDSTGTVWPERQRFLRGKGISVSNAEVESASGFGMNWKMTAKTILVQLHHKVDTLEHFSKHFVLVVQDHLLEYMSGQFTFAHLHEARIGDSMHFHAYTLNYANNSFRLSLSKRLSTDAAGIATCLGLQAEAKVELEVILAELEKKISANTLFTLGPSPMPPAEQMPSE
jgi:hypothetical protein